MKQQTALEFDLNLKDLLILDYMIKCFNSDSIRRRSKWEIISIADYLQQIFKHLPISAYKERQTKKIFIQNLGKGIVERLSELKNQLLKKMIGQSIWQKIFLMI